VAFNTKAALVRDDTNGKYDVYRYEVATGTYELVSRGLEGGAGNDSSYSSSISADGRIVGFESHATDLVEGPQADFYAQLYVRDMHEQVVRRVTTGIDGQPGNSYVYRSSLDRTSRFIAFDSNSTNLVPGHSGSSTDIFRAELATGAIALVSVGLGGAMTDGNSFTGAISANGRFVT
jgi:hypothetical protein